MVAAILKTWYGAGIVTSYASLLSLVVLLEPDSSQLNEASRPAGKIGGATMSSANGALPCVPTSTNGALPCVPTSANGALPCVPDKLNNLEWVL